MPCDLKFTAGQNAEFFMDKFCKVADVQKWSEEQMCLRFCLALPKEAETWYMSLSEEQKESFPLLKAAFLARFGPKESRNTLFGRFLDLRQNQQPVDEYAESVLVLGRRLRLSEDAIRDHIIFGLDAAIQRQVLLWEKRTIDDIVRFARIFEENSVKDSDNSMTREVRSKQNSVQTRDRRPDRSCRTVTCYSCGKYGHKSFDCRSKNATCFKCGKVGHLAKLILVENIISRSNFKIKGQIIEKRIRKIRKRLKM